MGQIKTMDDLTKENIIRDKTNVEAGYVDNPKDLGRVTNHGITEAVARKHENKLRSMFGWDGDMKTLTQEMAYYIYDVDYWRPMHLHTMIEEYPIIADQMFDFGINAGNKRPVSNLQTYLNVNNNLGLYYEDLVVDGWMGAKTFNALHKYIDRRGGEGLLRLMIGLLSLQSAHYINISVAREDNETFTYGWLGRIEHHITRYKQLLADY